MLSRPSLLRQLFDCLAEWRQKTSLPIGAIGAKMRCLAELGWSIEIHALYNLEKLLL